MQFGKSGMDGDEAETLLTTNGRPGEDSVNIDNVRLKHGHTYDRETTQQTNIRTMSGPDMGHRIRWRRWQIIALPFPP